MSLENEKTNSMENDEEWLRLKSEYAFNHLSHVTHIIVRQIHNQSCCVNFSNEFPLLHVQGATENGIADKSIARGAHIIH